MIFATKIIWISGARLWRFLVRFDNYLSVCAGLPELKCTKTKYYGRRNKLVKFLVLWNLQPGIRLGLPEVAKMLSDLQTYAKDLHTQQKLEHYYHVVGRHGGAWTFDVESNEELEVLLAKMPVHNFAAYEIYPLSEMKVP